MKKYLVLLLALALGACGKEQKDNIQNNVPMKVNVVQVQTATFNRTLSLLGVVQAKNSVVVGTPLQGLQLLEVKVDVGDRVKKGQVLAKLENSQVQSQLRQNDAALQRAKANLNAQQAALKEAEATLKRYQQLIKADAISHQELDQQRAKAEMARTAVQTAQAEIVQAKAQLDDSRHQRRKAEVIAPTDGVIIQRLAQAGNLTDNNALFHIAKDGNLEVVVQASADEISLLENGLNAEVQVLNQTVSGQVRLISSQIDATTQTGKVHIALQEKLNVPVGTPLTATIQLPTMNAQVSLPFSAINFGADGSKFVFVVDSDGKVAHRNIILGEVAQAWAEIHSGLEIGEQVVAKAGALLNEGDVVEAVLSDKVKKGT